MTKIDTGIVIGLCPEALETMNRRKVVSRKSNGKIPRTNNAQLFKYEFQDGTHAEEFIQLINEQNDIFLGLKFDSGDVFEWGEDLLAMG